MQNSISGSLPTEIGKLSSLVHLYRPSLSALAPVKALQGSKHLVVVAAMQSMAMGEGKRSTLCLCWQVCHAEQHLRLAAY